MTEIEERSGILRSFGAAGDTVAELLRYNGNHFQLPAGAVGPYPLPDEPFAATWSNYAAGAKPGEVLEYLALRLPQLNFPVRPGMSQSAAYQAATRRGESCRGMAEATGLVLRQPERLCLTMHATAAGRIALLWTPDREDFTALVQALTMRNEPHPLPESMGACIIAGYNNWDRIALLRSEWGAANPGASWSFAALPSKEFYQDRFILLSGEFYSAVPPEAVGLPAEQWREKSLVIRREHECTHYFTRRVFSSMRNHWLDELIADYCGIVAAAGRFRADWQLRFADSRLENYRGDPPLSGLAFEVLGKLARESAIALERLWDSHANALAEPSLQPLTVTALSLFTLEQLAAPDAPQRVWSRIESLMQTVDGNR
jgi:hypothetical protein